MKKGILLIAHFLIISVCSAQNVEEKSVEKDNSEMEVLVDNISELASKVLEIFEPIAKNTLHTSDQDNTYFVSFLLKDRRNKTLTNDDSGLQRMVVNNNFSGEKMGTNQVFVETGPPSKQPPAHNVQLLQNPLSSYQNQHYQQRKSISHYG